MTRSFFLLLSVFLFTDCNTNKQHSSFKEYLENLDELKVQRTNIISNQETHSFISPLRLVVHNDGKIIVVNHTDWSLYYLTKEGEILDKKGGIGRGPGEFLGINNIQISCNNTLYVLDKKLQKISVFEIKVDHLEHLQDHITPNTSPLSFQSYYNCNNDGGFGVFKNFHTKSSDFNSYFVFKLDNSLHTKSKIIDLTPDEVFKGENGEKDNPIGYKNYWAFEDGKLYQTYSHSLDVNIFELSSKEKRHISSPSIPNYTFTQNIKSEYLDFFEPYFGSMPAFEDEINSRKNLPLFHSYTANENFSFFTVFNLGAKEEDGMILRLDHASQELKRINAPKLFQLFDVQGNKLYGIQSRDGDPQIVVITFRN